MKYFLWTRLCPEVKEGFLDKLLLFNTDGVGLFQDLWTVIQRREIHRRKTNLRMTGTQGRKGEVPGRPSKQSNWRSWRQRSHRLLSPRGTSGNSWLRKLGCPWESSRSVFTKCSVRVVFPTNNFINNTSPTINNWRVKTTASLRKPLV